ncbi:MAG TPA: hypothetical protein VME66_13390, partial [Candidatus Acidoferrales bacterium]|nr:hypothetical protein [Candidatus Acidoferrales bacterium]
MSRRAATYKLLRRHWPLLIPALFTVSVFHAWFAPGLILGADWVRRVPDELNGYFPWPHVWNHAQQLGENDSYYFNYLPLFSLIGLCSRLQGSWNVIERIFFLWPYVAVSVFCPYVFLVRVTRSPYASAIGTCMWCINTWIIMAAERGAIPSLVAASLLPLFFLFALRFIERPRMVRGIGLAALLTAISLYDLRYVYIAIFFALVLASEQLLKDRSWKRAITAIPALLVACITTLILNLYWIIQQFFEATNPGAGYGTVLDYILNSHFMTPQHALAGFAVFYHWVASNDPFTPTNPDWYFFLIPVFTFVVYSLVWKRRWVWSLSIGYAVSMLLLCGPSWPVDKINIWIFAHVPGMMLFRDVTKWMSLLIISYSTVISMGIARFIAYTRLKLGAGRVMMTAPLLTGALAVCYALMMNDAYSPIRYRVFYTYNMHSDVVALERYLQSRPGHPRSLIFPRDIEPMRAISSHPYVEGLQIENSASPDGLRHLNLEWDSLYGFFSSPFAPDMLREMNVDYVVVPYDYDKVIYQGAISNWTFYDALQFMQSRPWLEFDRRIGRQYVFRMRDPMRAKAFIAPDPFVMNGGGATLAALVGTPLVNDRMAFLLPDQPLPNIWRRIPNYVGGAWPIDTNLAKIGKARLDVYAGERLARAAKSGRFVFTAAGVSTASGIPNLYSGDGPTLFDTHSATPGSGSATFSINLSDISTLNQTMFETRSFERSVSELSYAGADILYEPATREQATVTYVGRNRRDGIVEVQNGIGVALIADVNLSQLKIPIPFTATFEGKVATCPSDCTLRAVLWRPGVNRIVLHFALSKAQAAILRGTTFEAMLASQRPMSLPVTKTVTLLSGVSIPLRLRPYVDFRYGPLASNAAAMIYLRLRSTEDGRIVWYADELPQTGIYAQQLQYAINDALHVQFERLLDRHRFDYAWLAKNRLADEPDGAGLYDITAVMVSASPRIVP